MGAVRQSGTARFVDERFRPTPEAVGREHARREDRVNPGAAGPRLCGRSDRPGTSDDAQRGAGPHPPSPRLLPGYCLGPAAADGKAGGAKASVEKTQRAEPKNLAPERIGCEATRQTEAFSHPLSHGVSVDAPTLVLTQPNVVIEGGVVSFSGIMDGCCRFPLWPHTARPAVVDMRFCGQGEHCEVSSWRVEHLGSIRGSS